MGDVEKGAAVALKAKGSDRLSKAVDRKPSTSKPSVAQKTDSGAASAGTSPAGKSSTPSAMEAAAGSTHVKKAGEGTAAAAAAAAGKRPAAGKAPAGAAAAPSAGAAAAPAAAAAGAAAANATVAMCDLSDPKCTPGTPEFAAAEQEVRQKLELYRARVKQHLAQQRAKPDMIAYSELRGEHTPTESHGHIPGVRVGQEFQGRGELAILGLHTQMMRGIMARKDQKKDSGRDDLVLPAYAIAMSGGYKDDADTGSTFWYTGQGGQKKGKQVEDQTYDSADNQALLQSYKTGAPVRVFRGKIGAKQERLYVYEGLYKVTAHKKEPSQDGPLVCKFQMSGVPGHSVVSSTVEYGCLNRTSFQTVLLARGPAARPGKKRGRAGELRLTSRSDVEAAVEKRKSAGRHGRLVTADIAQGQEKLPIPVWNSVDDDDTILLHLGQPEEWAAEGLEDEPAAFEYITDYKFGEEEAKLLAIAAEKEFSSHYPGTCGIQFASKEVEVEGNYNEDGLMLSTQPCGLMECDEGCSCSSHCKLNRVVSEGVRYPLEVFKVNKRVGWGVRCSEDLPIGAFICCYVGLVITDDWADKLRHQDLYLFDLSHFHLLWEAEQAQHMPDEKLNPNLTPLEGELRSKHLVIDANRQGNIARFVNHSCEPNCLVQTVFAGNARSELLYYVAIVALKDIPAYTELTYDYGYSNKSKDAGGQDGNTLVRIRCQCGADKCRKDLL